MFFKTKERSIEKLINNLIERLNNGVIKDNLVDNKDQIINNIIHVWNMDNKYLNNSSLFDFRKEIGNKVEHMIMEKLILNSESEILHNYNQQSSHKLDMVEIEPDGKINLCDIKSTMGLYRESIYYFEINKRIIDKYKLLSIRTGKDFYLYIFLIRKNGVYKININELFLIDDKYIYNFRDEIPVIKFDIEEYINFLIWYSSISTKLKDEVDFILDSEYRVCSTCWKSGKGLELTKECDGNCQLELM